MFYECLRDNLPLFKIDECWCPLHFHKAIELIYNLAGDKTVYINDIRYIIKNNDVLAIMPYERHIFPLDETSEAMCAVLPVEYSDMFLKQFNGKKPQSCIVFDGSIAEKLAFNMNCLFGNTNEFKKSAAIFSILGELLDAIKLSSNQNAFVVDDFVHSVLQYIDNNYFEPLNLENLAKIFNYSKNHFSEMFNKKFSMNLNQYINTVRIHKSLDVIHSLAINDIYYKVGFNSQQQFFFYFKKIIGMTPGEYKKRNLGSFKA